jgi:oligopeptide/dipeptide ABC transporter ATP-binding protein
MDYQLHETAEPLLSIQNLGAVFQNKKLLIKAVDGIDLNVNSNEIHGIVGESGCGKTVTAMSILRLIPAPGRINNGRILWKNNDLNSFTEKQIRKVRGNQIAMIFQNPQMALNPLFKIGDQITDIIRRHQHVDKKTALNRANELMEMVKIPDVGTRFHYYPYQLSGGLCQRAMIAMAIACQPELLIADEPTAALDVTVQAQILDLLLDMHHQFKMSILLISHDMGVIARMCDRVSVMYLGRIVESSTAERLFADPRHPYTQGLLKAVPVPDPNVKHKTVIQGDVSTTDTIPKGCRFHPRCPQAFEPCFKFEPSMKGIDGQQINVACWLYEHDIHH